MDNRFNVTERRDGYLIKDCETGDNYSIEYDGFDNKYVCIDNHDMCIEAWGEKPNLETIINTIVDYVEGERLYALKFASK